MAKGQKISRPFFGASSPCENNCEINMMKGEKNTYANQIELVQENVLQSDNANLSSDYEGYYTAPNKIQPPQLKEDASLPTINTTKDSIAIQLPELPEDPEVRFAKAIIEADLEVVSEVLNQLKPDDSCVLMNINVAKITEVTNGALHDLNTSQINPFDLAAHYGQDSILDHLIDYGLESIPKFGNYIKGLTLIHPSPILNRLVVKCPKIAEELLNDAITSNHYSSARKATDSTVVHFDFGLFCQKKQPRDFEPESLPIERMLDQGHRELIKQPLTEAFIYLKWEKLSWAFYLAFVYRIFLALVVTLATLAEVSKHPVLVRWAPLTRPGLVWLLVAAYTPAAFTLAFDGLHKRSDFFLSSWVQLKKPCPRIPLPSLSCLVHCGLLASILAFVALVLTDDGHQSSALTHSAAWAVLLCWMSVLEKMAECPCIGVNIYILEVVLQDILAFFLSTIALLMGFSFAFHLLMSSTSYQHGFGSPISSFLTVLTMVVGHFGTNEVVTSASIPGTTEVIFLIFYVILSIGMMNILIGLCVANIKDIMMQKEDFKLGRMILNVRKIEDDIFFWAKNCQKWPRVSGRLVEMGALLGEASTVFSVFPFNNDRGRPQMSKVRMRTVLPLRFGNATSISNMAVFRETAEASNEAEDKETDIIPTQFSLPGWIWENARPILEERHELEKAQAEEERNRAAQASQNEDYTSLYWNPEAVDSEAAKSENEYEVVEEGHGRYFSGGILRSIRESLLRELRRDLARFSRPERLYGGGSGTRSSSSKSAAATDGKCVNVRPGLALGVITLQAGSRHKINLQ